MAKPFADLKKKNALRNLPGTYLQKKFALIELFSKGFRYTLEQVPEVIEIVDEADKEVDEILNQATINPDAFQIAVNAEIQNANTAKINDLKWEIRYTEGSINDLDQNHIAHAPNDQSLKERRTELVNELADLKAQLAEIERANTTEVDPIITDRNHNLIADHITGIKEEQAMTDKLIISTKENKNSKIAAYYLNSKRTRKAEIEYRYANNPAYDGIIQTDYYTAKYQFLNLYYGHGCRYFIMTLDEEILMSKAAADLLGYKIGRPFAKGIYRVTKLDHNLETIPDDDGSNDEPDNENVFDLLPTLDEDEPDAEPYRPIAILNHNINWAKGVLATMQGDIYIDNLGAEYSRAWLQESIKDWTEERDDIIIKSGKLTSNHKQKKNIRDSLNRAIKQCIRNRIGYLKSHNSKMEKYEYELLCLLQGARRELEVA